jgi:hypothetical protein
VVAVCALTLSANTTHAILPAAFRIWVDFIVILLLVGLKNCGVAAVLFERGPPRTAAASLLQSPARFHTRGAKTPRVVTGQTQRACRIVRDNRQM